MGRDLHLPSDGSAAGTAAVVLHPHPAMGGDRHHPLVIAVAERLARDGVAALRIDLTDPDIHASAAALADVGADLLTEVGADRLVLIGYSWGAAVAAQAPAAAVVARVLVAPPVSITDVGPPPAGAPTLVLVPEHDQYGPPDAARAAVDGWPDATLEVIDGIDHFLAGATARIADRSVTWLAEHR